MATSAIVVLAAGLAALPIASHAADDSRSGRMKQAGDDRWVPSLAIISGISIQKQTASGDTFVFEGTNPDPVLLREPVDGDDISVAPFVGASLEIMAPALPVPGRPRVFLSGEILPTFGSKRDIAVQGDPGCVRGPEPDAICAADEDGTRVGAFNDTAANGQGSKTSAKLGPLFFGASIGVAIPFRIAHRQLRIKPSFSWINYELEASAFVSDANCPTNRCTDTTSVFGIFRPGLMRETTLSAGSTSRFNGIGPGVDLEMDVARAGPLATSLFMGARAYYILGERKIQFSASESFDDAIGMDTAVGEFEVEVQEWMYRAHLGIRFQWVGNR